MLEAQQFFHGVPVQPFAAALMALSTSQLASGALSRDTASWSWLLREVADRTRGLELIEESAHPHRDILMMTATGYCFVMCGATEIWEVGPRREPPPRILVRSQRPQNRLELHLSKEAWSMFKACEIHCVAGCCGLDAFDFGSSHIKVWSQQVAPELTELVALELHRARDVIEAQDEVVSSKELNTSMVPKEWIELLDRIVEKLRPR